MQRFFEYCEQQKAALVDRAARLAREGRTDESHLDRVRSNIYGLCRSMCAVEFERGAFPACEAAIEHLKTEWQSAMEYAEAHDDGERAIVNRVKLEALVDISEQLKEEET